MRRSIFTTAATWAVALAVWFVLANILADSIRVPVQSASAVMAMGVAVWIAYAIRSMSVGKFIVGNHERVFGWFTLWVSLAMAAWAVSDLVDAPIGVEGLGLAKALAKHGYLEVIFSKFRWTLVSATLLNLAAAGLLTVSLSKSGYYLEALLIAVGRIGKGMDRDANGELTGNQGFMRVRDAVEASLGGGIILGQIDHSLDRNYKRRKRTKFGETEESDVSPDEIEEAMAKAARAGNGEMPQVVMKVFETHGTVIGASGAGKGTGFIIPNLLCPILKVDATVGLKWWRKVWERYFIPASKKVVKWVKSGWDGSVLVIDPKGENFVVVLLQRLRLGRRMRLIDPYGSVEAKSKVPGFGYLARVKRASFNMLDMVPNDDDPTFASIVKSLPPLLIEVPKEAGNGKYFYDGAMNITESLIAQICSIYPKVLDPVTGKLVSPPERSLALFYEIVNSPLLSCMVSGEGWPESCCDEDGKLLPEYAQWDMGNEMWYTRGGSLPKNAAGQLRDAGKDNERGGLINTVRTAFQWLGDPIIRKHCSYSSFDIDDWFAGKDDIFVTVPPDKIKQIKGYMRVWASLPLLLAGSKGHLLASKKERNVVCVDEGPILGRLETLLDAYGIARGYGISYVFISQTRSQLESVYSREECDTFLGNSEFTLILKVAPADKSMAEWVSASVGKVTRLIRNRSSNRGVSGQAADIGGGSSGGINDGGQLQGIAILDVAEVNQMQDGDSILFWSPSRKARKPIRCRGARYFANPDIAKLALPNPFRPGEKGPSEEVVSEIDALLEAGADYERVVEVPDSLIPEEFRTGLSSGSASASTSGPMKLDKATAESLAPPRSNPRDALAELDIWENSVPATPDLSKLTNSLDNSGEDDFLPPDEAFEGGAPSPRTPRLPPNMPFEGDMDDEMVGR